MLRFTLFLILLICAAAAAAVAAVAADAPASKPAGPNDLYVVTAKWCPHCQTMKPRYTRWAKAAGWKIIEIDVGDGGNAVTELSDGAKVSAATLGVKQLPTFIAVRRKDRVSVGVIPGRECTEAELKAILASDKPIAVGVK